MKNRIVYFILCSLLCLSIFLPAYAQNNNYPFSNELKDAFSNRTEVEKKISSDLYSKIFTYEKFISNGLTNQAMKNFDKEFYRIDGQGRIFVLLRLNSKDLSEGDQVKEKIELANGKFENIFYGHNGFCEIKCWIPINEINNLANINIIAAIKTPAPTYFRTYTTAGDEQLKAVDVRTSMNVTGEWYKVGIKNKIGVISDGVSNYSTVQLYDELPEINILNNGDIYGDEGTAMLEIIHDIAPGSELYFYGLTNTADMNNWFLAISSLKTAGCNIIVDDLYSPEEPFFSDESVFGDVIRGFIDQGGVYVTAGGNESDNILDEYINIVNSYHIFTTNNDYLNITVPSDDQQLSLQWKDSWVNPSIDLGIEFYDANGVYLFTVDEPQSAMIPPIEIVELSAGDYRIKIKSNSNNANNIEFKLFGNKFAIENNGTYHVFGHAAYPNVISVAAYDAEDETTTTDFSSVGPANMYSTAEFNWTTQYVPTITATSGVQTYVGSENIWEGGYPVFSGTSASAPHIAGLAALYFHKLNAVSNLNKTNFDFYNDLTLSATTIGNETGGTWHEKSGFGKANILDAINRSANTVVTPIITPLSGSYYLSVTCTLSCQTPGATIKYTDDGSEPNANHGLQYSTPFTITTNKTIKAMAYKNGLIASGVKTESYVITTVVTPTVTPPNGSYPYGMEIAVNWPTGYRCFANYNYGDGISAPPDPLDPQSTGGGNLEFTNHPSTYTPTNVAILKMKFQLYSPSTQQWGPVVSRQYDIKPSLRIAQVDEEINPLFYDNIFEGCKKWEYNNWQNQTTEFTFRPSNSIPYFLLAQQSFKDQTTRKYRLWTINGGQNNYINHIETTVGPNTSTVLAYFKNASNVTIKNKLENSFSVDQGWFYFKDPWFIDDLSDSKGPRNRGVETPQNPLTPVPMVFKTTQNITTDLDHKGVFLNQGGTGFTPPYYSVKVDALQDIPLTQTGKTHMFYFQNWSGTNVNYKFPTALETPVVFSENAIAEAVYKGTQLTNISTAYSFNGQTKFLKTPNGTPNGMLHNVYESMGNVWYERSTDGGITWAIMNNGLPVNYNDGSSNAKSPAISSSNDSNDPFIYIVYQADNVWGNTGAYVILTQFYHGLPRWPMTQFVSDVLPSYSYDTKPVVTGLNQFAMVVYKSASNAPLTAVEFKVNASGNLIQIIPRNFPAAYVNSSCGSPTITNGEGKYHLAYQWGVFSIGYLRWSVYTDPSTSNYYSSPSNGSGYNLNMEPSISLANFNPVISWKGSLYAGSPQAVLRRGTLSGSNMIWSDFLKVGSNINYVHSNSASNSTEKTVMTWSQDGSTTKWVKRTYPVNGKTEYSNPQGLNPFGINSQVSWGTDYNNMKANIFRSSAPLYYFTQSTTDFSVLQEQGGELNKIAIDDTIVTFGRSGVADINGIEFVFNIGDILVGDGIIQFIDKPDTIVYASSNELNEFTRTNNFTLNPETNFYFSNIYYVVQKSDPDTALTNTDAVNFRAELVNAITNQVVGTFDNITYNKNNLDKYANIDYEVDCSGITPGDYYLRLVTSVNGDANYALANIIIDNTTLAKKNYNKVNFTGSEIPITYELSNNFPNPFNPSTTIRYQIPQDGIVTLKIYDILGSEVATLVNEEKVAGKYEVNFNASSLASGVYIYKIQAGSFINSKKMILLK